MKKSKKRITVLTLLGIKDLDDYDSILKKLGEGININARDSGGRTLLMEAVIYRKYKLIELLIRQEADVNIRDNRNWTALHFASRDYDLISTKLLVENGADVNAQDDYGNTVISNAVFSSHGNGDVIKFLRKYGADINIKNKSGISALDLAKTISNYDILSFLS